jgi:hypothetical protein
MPSAPLVVEKVDGPGGYTSSKVVCRSFETYMRSWVEKYELVRECGTAAAARRIAAAIAALFVASPEVWKTTTFGGRMPVPNALSVRWFAS